MPGSDREIDRLELAQLNSAGARVNARGLRFGVTVR